MRTHAPRKAAAKDTAPSAAIEYFSRKLEFDIGPYSLKGILDNTPARVLVVDVRNAEAFSEGHIPAAISIPLLELTVTMGRLPKDRTIVTYCGDITCQMSSRAALELAKNGFKVQHLVGGILEWSRKGYPIESARSAEPDQTLFSDRTEPEPKAVQEHEGGPME